MISKELKVSSPMSTLKKDISTNKRGSNERLDLGYLNDDKINKLNSEFKALKKQLNGMILTDMAGLSVMKFAAFAQLKKLIKLPLITLKRFAPIFRPSK